MIKNWIRTLFILVATAATLSGHADTRSLGDLTPGSASSFAISQTDFGGVYLQGLTYFITTNCKLWKTDGTAANTVLAVDFSGGATTCFGSVDRLGNQLLLTRSNTDNHVDGILVSSGTSASTQVLSVPGLHVGAPYVTAWQNRPGWLLLIYQAAQSELWATDGSVANTLKLASLGGFSGASFAFLNQGRLAIGGANGLWLADQSGNAATAVGTGITNIGDSDNNLATDGENLYFTADDAAHGQELWFSDLTSGGTHMVEDFTTGPANTTFRFQTYIAPYLYFIIGDVLWRTDGTIANTIALTAPGAVISQSGAVAVGGKLIFAGQGNDGYHLWHSDGTPGGTVSYTGSIDSQYPFYSRVVFGDVFYYREGHVVGSNPTVEAVYETNGAYNMPVGFAQNGNTQLLGRSAVIFGQDVATVFRHDGIGSLTMAGPDNHNTVFGVTGPILYFGNAQTTTGSEPYAMDLAGTNVSICSSPNLPIKDNDSRPTEDVIVIPQHYKITNLTIDLKVSHTYVGDLQFELLHTATGRIITLIPQEEMCQSDDFDVVMDDLGDTDYNAATCNPDAAGKAYPAGTRLRPVGALAGFVGEDLNGRWVLRSNDLAADDVGGITQWCMDTTGISDVIFKDGFEGPLF